MLNRFVSLFMVAQSVLVESFSCKQTSPSCLHSLSISVWHSRADWLVFWFSFAAINARWTHFELFSTNSLVKLHNQFASQPSFSTTFRFRIDLSSSNCWPRGSTEWPPPSRRPADKPHNSDAPFGHSIYVKPSRSCFSPSGYSRRTYLCLVGWSSLHSISNWTFRT